MMSESRRSYNR